MDVKKMMNNKKLIIVILLVALTAAVIFLVSTHKSPSDQSQGSVEDTESDELKGDPIETPAGEVIIPEYWADQVEIEDTSTDEFYSQTFYKTVNGEKVLLYVLQIGGEGAGYELGSVPGENGDRLKVWLDISEIEKDESWSDEEYNEINTIQSGVNDLIDQIYQMDGFQKPEN